MYMADPPVVANGIVFAYGSGESTTQRWAEPGHVGGAQGRIQESTHAILYALDAQTGKELWSSGDQIASWNHFSGLSVANGRVYIGTFDGMSLLLWRGESASTRHDLAARGAMTNRRSSGGGDGRRARRRHSPRPGAAAARMDDQRLRRAAHRLDRAPIRASRSQTMVRSPVSSGAFKFLWKLKLEHDPKAADRAHRAGAARSLIGFRGFKSIAFVGTQSETVHAIDYDFGTPLWKYHINYSASPPPVLGGAADCPGGLTAAVSRPTAFAPPAAGGGGGGGGGGARSGGGVGEPGRGATTLATAGARPRSARQLHRLPARARAHGPGAVPGSAAAAAGQSPGGLPGGARRAGGQGGGGGRGGGSDPARDAAYVVGSDGYLHALNVSNGWDNMTPALFLPSNTRATGLIVASSDAGRGRLRRDDAWVRQSARCGMGDGSGRPAEDRHGL